jgi:DNA primase large subunit
MALDRLQVLKKIEFMFDSNSNEDQIRSTIQNMCKQHRIAVEPKFIRNKDGTETATTIKKEEAPEMRENDNVSHFICRLAYCRNEELRRWFLQ